MKIKHKILDYGRVIAMKKEKYLLPRRPSPFFRKLLAFLSAGELRATDFTVKKIGMKKLPDDQPCMILMNHSAFIDLKIAATVFADRPFNIVCTSDGFVGKRWLMYRLGCIPTNKFVSDFRLVRNIAYTIRKNKCSVLMYPEASYSFDGKATPLPDTVGKCLKMLGVPVIMVRTYGAFLHDPLYNGLRQRKVKVSAEVEYLLSPEDLKSMDASEIGETVNRQFEFDNFRWQRDNNIKVDADFRAQGLERVLYKCPSCKAEGETVGVGDTLVCRKCGKKYFLTETGEIHAVEGGTEIDHIPDWFDWERECVKSEIESGTYLLDIPVRIMMMVNSKSIYEVGSGRLVHRPDGFELTGCDGRLVYRQRPDHSYSLYSDYFWYEIGDMICIGDQDKLFYCFPEEGSGNVVAKTRLAVEELYKRCRAASAGKAKAAAR